MTESMNGMTLGLSSPEIDARHAHLIPALRDESAGIEYRPIPLSEIGPSEPPDWIWPGFVARKHITLFTGLWKAGKTTMLTHLLHDLTSGGALAQPLGGPTLIVSEETTGLWARRRDAHDLGDGIQLLSMPFGGGKPTMTRWLRCIDDITTMVNHGPQFQFVAIDTIASLWPVREENDASSVIEALGPLRAITEAGAGLMLTHHPRKGDAQEAQASRGSGAVPGFVDMIVEMRRMDRSDARDRRRVLTTYGRLEDIEPEVVVKLTDDGYVYVGDRVTVAETDRLETIRELLPGQPGLTLEEVLDRFPAESRPGGRRLRESLTTGVDRGLWSRSGKGVKGDPHRFFVPVFGSGGSLPLRPESKIDAEHVDEGDAPPVHDEAEPAFDFEERMAELTVDDGLSEADAAAVIERESGGAERSQDDADQDLNSDPAHPSL